MTANAKYQKERAKDNLPRIKDAVLWAVINYTHPNIWLGTGNEHKRLKLI